MIAVIGPTSAGKTSLIACLCDLFQLGPVDRLHFAGSRTFSAFEQACHHARASSRRVSPQTEHTSLSSGLGFYHLGILNRAESKTCHLLFADRSGEEYRAVADDPTVAAQFVEIPRADVITALVNGERLRDVAARHNTTHELLMILQGLLNGDVLSSRPRLAVVLTKLDVINGAESTERERAERDFDALLTRINDLFGAAFQEIRSFKIAASPASVILSHGFGVPALLEYWMAPKVGVTAQSPAPDKSSRAMGRFGMFDAGGLS